MLEHLTRWALSQWQALSLNLVYVTLVLFGNYDKCLQVDRTALSIPNRTPCYFFINKKSPSSIQWHNSTMEPHWPYGTKLDGFNSENRGSLNFIIAVNEEHFWPKHTVVLI